MSKSFEMARICTLLGASLLLYGCSGQHTSKDFEPVPIYQSNPLAQQGGSLESIDPKTEQSQSGPRVEYIEGTGNFARPMPSTNFVGHDEGGGISLAFKNTDIRVILRAVLADTLGLSYSVDARVQGAASLETSGAVSKEALRLSLEALLKTKGYALVPSSDGYIVLPISEAPGSIESLKFGQPASSSLPGFGVHIVPLEYTRPSELRRLIEPLSPNGGILLTDDTRSIVVLAGTSQEVATMKHAIQTFDIDRMQGMSFGVFKLQYVDPEQIRTELEQVFKAGDGNAVSPVQFIPVPRINKLIAVAPNRDLLSVVDMWVQKLDLGESAPGRRIYVYHVKNGRASDLAATLNAILGTEYSGQNAVRNLATSNNRNRRNSSNALQPSSLSGDSLGSGGVKIVPSKENNSLVIMAAPSEFATIEGAIKKIDQAPRQVLVEVTLADVTLTDELRYGLKWHFEFGDNSVAFGSMEESATKETSFSWSYNNLSDVNAILTALESVTDVKVISAPKLLVLNNQSATLQVGDEVPVPTASAVSTNNGNAPIVNNIEYRNTGVILSVTPRISEDGLVMLDVEQEVSNVVETASSGIDAPTIQQRRMVSTVAVQDGSTIALGGLIRRTVSKNNSGVPLLKDIPLLGTAFKNGGFTERRSELIVLLTPRIIQDAQQTRDVMDYIRKEFRAVLGDAPKEQAEE